jgi:hypothetical protein
LGYPPLVRGPGVSANHGVVAGSNGRRPDRGRLSKLTSLLGEDPPEDAAARIDLAMEALARRTVETEPKLCTILQLSLEPNPDPHRPLVLRWRRAIGWLEEALAPPHDRMPRVKLSCCGTFGEDDIEAELVEPLGEALRQPGALGTLEVVRAEVVVVHLALEHDVDRREDRARHRHDGLLWTATGLQPQEERPEVAALGPHRAPGGLDEQGLEPGGTRPQPGGAALARALVVARA